MFKKKYIVIFYNKDGNFYTEVIRKRIKSTTENVNFKDNAYIIDISQHSYSKGLNNYYCYDISTKDLLLFIDIKTKINTKYTDLILNKHVIVDFTKNLNDKPKRNWMDIIFGVLIGGFSTYIVMGFI